MPKRLTAEEFIAKAKSIHGEDRYDYSFVDYKNSHTKVKIICPTHGAFEQAPTSHLAGNGCAKCGFISQSKSKSYDTNDFTSKAKIVHGDRFDYSHCKYTTSRSKVEIICPIHGPFLQAPVNHLSGQGCPYCGIIKRAKAQSSDIDEFTYRAKMVHGDQYDYSSVDYVNAFSKVEIICPKHGSFFQVADSHLRGRGCRHCSNIRKSEKLSSDTNEFVSRANVIHNNQYDYSLVKYAGANTKVEIICKEHGSFKQTPNNHLQGQGCLQCYRQIQLNDSNAWRISSWKEHGKKSASFSGFKCYLILAGDGRTGEYFIKVGRTYRDIHKRFSHFPYQYKLIHEITGSAENIYNKEVELKRLLSPYKTIPSLPFGGCQECFSISALDVAMTAFEESHNKMQTR